MSKGFHDEHEYITAIEDADYIYDDYHMIGVKITTDKSEIILSICDGENFEHDTWTNLQIIDYEYELWDYSKMQDFDIYGLIDSKILGFEEIILDVTYKMIILLIIKVQKIGGEFDEITLFVENAHCNYQHKYHIKYLDVNKNDTF